MILAERLVGERLPFAGLAGGTTTHCRNGWPRPEGSKRCAPGSGQRAHAPPGSVSLNTIPVRESPNTTLPERFTHGMLNTLEARASSCQAQIASTMSS